MDEDKSERILIKDYKADEYHTARKVGGMSKIERECYELDEEYRRKIIDDRA